MARDKTLDEVVGYLFTNGAKQKGNRLILVDEDYRGSAVVSKARDLGGWGNPVIRDLLKDFAATVRKEARAAAFREAADYIDRQWLKAYPIEVFPEPPKPPAECSRDRISAAMGRHIATKLIEHFEAAANTEEGGGDG